MELKDFKLYRMWKGGVWTGFTFDNCPFVYWTRQPTLYSGKVVLEREIYNHQRNIRHERFE